MINSIQAGYMEFIPGGNNTALVMGTNYSSEEKKSINEVILISNPRIEQVGFINSNKPELQMAGGEFCGNATRSAAFYYLQKKPGKLQIKVNSKDIINAGVYENGDAWCEIPLYQGKDAIVKKEEGIYQVKMNGMVSVVIQEQVSKRYLKDKTKLKEVAMQFIDKYSLRDNEAVGVMFVEKKRHLEIHPVVWVRDINTLYYETGCGSGTTATAMVEAVLAGQSKKIEIMQPSGLAIIAEITVEEGNVTKAVISGKVSTDDEVVSLFID